MRIVVPYTRIAPETFRALAVDAPEALYFKCEHEDSYYHLLADAWAKGEDFAIVEQDIIVRPDTFDSFTACPSPICVAPYPYLRSEVYAGLGCIRFRAEAMRRDPTLWERVATHQDRKHPQRHWCTLDAFMQRELRVGWCREHPPVGHLHRRPSHGCVPVEYMDREGIPA